MHARCKVGKFRGFVMRLSKFEIETLVRAAHDYFEPDAVVRLFGSRLDDAARGGDIDLLIETRMTDANQIARAHTRFLSYVYARLGEQKIDLLIDFPTRRQKMPIYEVARSQGVLL